MKQKKFLDRMTALSLYIEVRAKNESAGNATGFIVERNKQFYLITSMHVFFLADSIDELIIVHHGEKLGTWVPMREKLYDGSKPRWMEHPNGPQIDVVALPLRSIYEGIRIYPLDLDLANTDIIPMVSMHVSIIGFPSALTSAGYLPLWKTGRIASDPDLDYEGNPIFLIDSTAKPGNSGSPVILRRTGGYFRKSGEFVRKPKGIATLFMGVLSGTIKNESGIDEVWKPRVLHEIFQANGV